MSVACFCFSAAHVDDGTLKDAPAPHPHAMEVKDLIGESLDFWVATGRGFDAVLATDGEKSGIYCGCKKTPDDPLVYGYQPHKDWLEFNALLRDYWEEVRRGLEILYGEQWPRSINMIDGGFQLCALRGFVRWKIGPTVPDEPIPVIHTGYEAQPRRTH